MHTTLAAQLAQLELGHLSIDRNSGPVSTALPESEAVEQTLAGVWSDLMALFPETAIEEDCEEIAWGLVNIFHRAACKRSAEIDRATDEIRCLLASADGSEVHSSELERQVGRARAAEAAMLGLEAFREAAARLYINETGRSWRPAGGSRLNHSAALTSAVVDGRDFLRARAESRKRAAMPEGTPVLFAGGRLSFATAADAKTLANAVWATLDKVRERVADISSSTVATARASTASPPPGRSGARSRRSPSGSTGGSGPAPGSGATNRCFRWPRAASSRLPATACWNAWLSPPRKRAFLSSTAVGRLASIPSCARAAAAPECRQDDFPTGAAARPPLHRVPLKVSLPAR
jgi:hypothetical protein